MTKYISEERFIVSSNTKEAIKNYADNYDRIFGKKDEEETHEGSPPYCPVSCPVCHPDAIVCRLSSYVNFIPPGPNGVINDVFDGPFCVGCGVGLEVDPKPQCCTECYRHDAACAKLCTEDAECDCGAG